MHRRISCIVALALGVPALANAQSRLSPKWEIPGFDFRVDGAFRKWAARVAARRSALLSGRRFAELNAPVAAGAPMASEAAVSGTVQIPAVLFQFAGGNLPQPGRDTGSYTTVLFGATPPGGNPYTERTFYEQLSNGLLSLQGNALGFVTLDSGENYYAGTPGSCSGSPFGGSQCNGLFSGTAQIHMQLGLKEALQKLEATMHPDWSRYAFDSTTGFINLVIFIQPAIDGACGPSNAPANHLWSHRWNLVTLPGGFYQTQTPWPGHSGQFLKISDYTLQSGVGGVDPSSSPCDGSAIMAIGTATHETGHAFGLPDLYDVLQESEGAGEWSLMGSGNYTMPYSPSRMDAWSLNQLGWVTVVPLAGSGTYSFGPAPTSDTAFLIRPRGANPRGEYFLLENRQAALADTALIRVHCAVSGNPPGCGGGMLIWHIDSEVVAECNFPVNCVNVGGPGTIHGVEVIQADGLGNLDATPGTAGSNRGDAGDPWPGVSGNHNFGPPRAVMNSDGSFVGFSVDSITQLSPGGPMSFQLRLGSITTVTSNDTGAVIRLDGVAYHRIQMILDSGSTHTIAVADTQVRADSLVRYVFQSWSDGGADTHSITISGVTDSISASLALAYRVKLVSDTGGTVTSNRDSALAGDYLTGGSVTFTAHPHAGSFFLGWTGDTVTIDTTLLVSLTHPYRLNAGFSGPLPLSAVIQQVVQGSSTLTAAQRTYLDQNGNKNSVFGDIGDFLAWVRKTHPIPPGAAPVRAARNGGAQ